MGYPKGKKFTGRFIESLPLSPGKQVVLWDAAQGGFGVVIGKTAKTFVAQGSIAGRKGNAVRVSIGRYGDLMPDGGQTWNVARARAKAQELLVMMRNGQDPRRPAPRLGEGLTLREGLELHVGNMKKKRRSPRSIHTIETEIPRLLKEWLDRPLVELTAIELQRVVDRILKETPARAGTNNPPGAALANRLIAQTSAIWNAVDKLHELPGRNPARKLTMHSLKPRTERIPHEGFGEWHATVQGLSPVRRDLQLFTLFTGLRSDSVRHVRFEHVDTERGVLMVERAKGSRPYTVPLPATCMEIIERRRRENPIEFGPFGGDQGWVFPTLSRSRPFRVIPVQEPKQRVKDAEGKQLSALPGLHTLRKTYNSVAMEIGTPRHDREALMNHEGRGVNTKHYGFPADWGHLAECQAKIEAALWERIKAGEAEATADAANGDGKPKRAAKPKRRAKASKATGDKAQGAAKLKRQRRAKAQGSARPAEVA